MSSVAESPLNQATVEDVLFSDLQLSNEVQLSVQMSGYLKPTPIQAEIIPYMLEGRDVLAQSQTGTGKTAAFALPILSRLQAHAESPQVLVLAPTRELATQVAQSFETYGSCIHDLRVAAIYGGADYDPQLRLLKRGAQIVVGTPGRVLDHVRRGTLKLENVRCLVLDEADEMLNMGFIDDVEFVLSATPEDKQIALFSATLPGPIRMIADQHLKNPASITIHRKTLTADNISQRCVFVEEREKLELLSRLLEIEETDGVIVFTKTKDSTVVVAEYLAALGLKAAALNGDLPQARRQRTVDQLKSGQLDIIVATDVAARGLDVPRISHVFNFDLPHDGESYVHRIGRTGRAGRAGVAVIFLTQRQRGKLRLIEKVTRKSIEIIEPPNASEITKARVNQFKAKIAKSLTGEELALFQKVVTDFVAESGKPIEQVAAALASMAQGGRSLLVKEQSRARPKWSDGDSRERDRGDRDRGERSERGDRPRRGKGRESSRDEGPSFRSRRTSSAPESGMQRYWIGVGHSDGVRPGNIVGAVANEGGISSKYIGPITIRDEFSTIDLPEGLPPDVLSTLERVWVAGKQLRIRIFRDGGKSFEDRSSDDRATSKRPAAGKPRRTKTSPDAKRLAQFESKAERPKSDYSKSSVGKKTKKKIRKS